jgi:DNA-binding IclR family transcriptional regulator
VGRVLGERCPTDEHAAAQVCSLLGSEVGKHPLLERAHLAPIPIEQLSPIRRECHHEPAPVVGIAMAFDEVAVLQRRDHVCHRLCRDEGVAGQLGRGEIGVPFQHGQSRVLQRRHPDRTEDVVQAGPDCELQLLHHVQQRRLCGLPAGVAGGHGTVLVAGVDAGLIARVRRYGFLMGSNSVSVPAKLLKVLDAFTHERAAYTVSELARRTGLPLSTAHRLIGELERWGGLERGEDRRYRIGLRFVEVGSLCPRGLGLRDHALPYMEDLYEATHQNVQLAVRDGLEGVYIERIAGRRAVAVRTKVGARWPLHATGVGLVLLAYAPVDVLEQVLAAPLASFTPFTINDAAALRHVLAEVRRSGYAVSDRQVTDDAYSVGAPIFGPDKECVAALSIVLPADDPHRASWGAAVRAAANGISRQLRDREPSVASSHATRRSS